MTERWKNDDDSVSNTTISMTTLPKNGDALLQLAKNDDDSVGDGGLSDAEGEGEFELSLLEGAAYDTAIKRRDNDNNNIEENLNHSGQNFTKSPLRLTRIGNRHVFQKFGHSFQTALMENQPLHHWTILVVRVRITSLQSVHPEERQEPIYIMRCLPVHKLFQKIQRVYVK